MSGLGRKRKAAEDSSPLSMYQHILQRFRQDPFLAGVEEEKWAQFSAKLLSNPQLPGLHRSPRFEEALPFYAELFEGEEGRVELAEEPWKPHSVLVPAAAPSVFEEAAAELRLNPLWKDMEKHVVIDNERPYCRIAIDLVLLTAMNLAQKQIDKDPQLDSELGRRRFLPKTNPGVVGSRVVLHTGVDIPPQDVLPHLSVHGALDYAFSVVHSKNGPLMTRAGLHIREHFLSHFKQPGGSVQVAMNTSESMLTSSARVAVQAAALCVLWQSTHIVNALTDGVRWRFLVVEELSSTTSPKPTPTPTRPTPPLGFESPRPFKSSATRMFDIFAHDGRGLAIVLRLLTVMILESPEDFAKRSRLFWMKLKLDRHSSVEAPQIVTPCMRKGMALGETIAVLPGFGSVRFRFEPERTIEKFQFPPAMFGESECLAQDKQTDNQSETYIEQEAQRPDPEQEHSIGSKEAERGRLKYSGSGLRGQFRTQGAPGSSRDEDEAQKPQTGDQAKQIRETGDFNAHRAASANEKSTRRAASAHMKSNARRAASAREGLPAKLRRQMDDARKAASAIEKVPAKLRRHERKYPQSCVGTMDTPAELRR
ncbi:hypothetical protein DFH06DRAFT_1136848 [Mycena polygramma]|nr:hypothetical protein DFH06DRAFT_1136848 [Mycena polygramma]